MHTLLKKSFLTFFILFLLFGSFLTSPPTAKGFLCTLAEYIDALNVVLPGPDIDVAYPNPWYDQSTCQFLNKVYNSPEEEIFGERYTFAQVNWIINSLFALVFPFNFLFNTAESFRDFLEFFPLGQAPSNNPFAMLQLGLPGLALSTINYTLNTPPASGVAYTKDLASRFNIVQPAHAQGYGYNALGAVLQLWSLSRDSAYFLLVIFLVAAGFLIIFRVKIGPQAIVTLQMIIPRVIITLLLVTFSYAIAGFVIDLIYVALTLVLAIFVPSSPTIVGLVVAPGAFVGVWLIFLLLLIPIFLVPTFGGPIVALVVGIVVTFIFLRISWMLMKTYVTLLALIILGPWQIMLGLIPDARQDFLAKGVGGWLRSLVANASVFVVTPLMIIFGMILFFEPVIGLLRLIVSITPLNGTPVDDLISSFPVLAGTLPTLPLTPTSLPYVFAMTMGYVILALTPKTAEMIRDMLKIPPFKYGTAIGESFIPAYDLTVGKFSEAQAKAASRQAAAAKQTGNYKEMADAEASAANWQRRSSEWRRNLQGK